MREREEEEERETEQSSDNTRAGQQRRREREKKPPPKSHITPISKSSAQTPIPTLALAARSSHTGNIDPLPRPPIHHTITIRAPPRHLPNLDRKRPRLKLGRTSTPRGQSRRRSRRRRRSRALFPPPSPLKKQRPLQHRRRIDTADRSPITRHVGAGEHGLFHRYSEG
jgi:hypothetical protein